MNKQLCFFIALLILSTASVQAQDLPRGEEVVLSTTELNSLARKMAELRARRVALFQQRQLQWQQFYALQQGAAAGGEVGRKEIVKEIEVRVDAQGNADTLVMVDNSSQAGTPSQGNSGQLESDLQALQQEVKSLAETINYQQEILLGYLDSPTAKSATVTSRDTVVQRIMAAPDPNRLTREDLRRVSTEMSDLNSEIQRLRNRVEFEESRRRRAEDRMQDALRNAEFSGRRNVPTPVRPDVRVDRQPRVTIVRDTVYVDRITTAPAKVDTVIEIVEVIKEAEPEVKIIRDTVTQEKVVKEEVVKTETVQLAAKEPISFPTIFFDNNSASLNTNHRNIISTMIEDMQNKGTYNVRLIGYASKSGNANYNQQLSARRAEAVKAGLLQMGIPASRIRLVAGGIDFQASTPAAGRRVEIKAIPQ